MSWVYSVSRVWTLYSFELNFKIGGGYVLGLSGAIGKNDETFHLLLQYVVEGLLMSFIGSIGIISNSISAILFMKQKFYRPFHR